MRTLVPLLRTTPLAVRNVGDRAASKSPETIAVARQFGREYFDGDRRYGYGGYSYDGRWRSVARETISTYMLGPGSRVLDVGCAKGFYVSDLCSLGIDAYGIDISRYAVAERPHPEVVGRLHLGSADALPYPDRSFDFVASINTLHNLPRPRLVSALREISRVSRGPAFVQVDSYRTQEERELFESWVLTAETHGTPEYWLEVFAESGYDGDYAWTFVGGK